jgi:hypothetical protein
MELAKEIETDSLISRKCIFMKDGKCMAKKCGYQLETMTKDIYGDEIATKKYCSKECSFNEAGFIESNG